MPDIKIHSHKLGGPIARTLSPLYATQENTTNWAGVVATGWGYSDISSTWTIPTIGNKQNADVSPWIGLGGDTYDGGGNIPQVGSDLYLDGQIQATATLWWEDFPSIPNNISPPPGVRSPLPGDSIDAEVTDGSNQVYFLIDDLTNGEFFGKWISAQPSNGSTADWVIEYNLSYLADFPNGVGFLSDYATRNGVSQNIGQLPTNAVDMFRYYSSGTYTDQQAFPGPIHNGTYFYVWWTNY